MNHYELLLQNIGVVLHWHYLLPIIIGTIAGVIGGALPGVTITMTVIVVLPFTFGLDPLQGLAAMIGVYVGGSAGGPPPRSSAAGGALVVERIDALRRLAGVDDAA